MAALPAGLDPAVRAFAERLREIYATLDTTLVQLEGALHLDSSTLSRYFAGTLIPEVGFLGSLFEVLHAKAGYPATPELQESTRLLYDAALEVRDPSRLEVYRLREQVAQLTLRAALAEEEVEALRADLKVSGIRQGELAANLRQIEAYVSDALGPEIERLRVEQLLAIGVRTELEERVRHQTGELNEKLQELRAVDEAYNQVVRLLRQAEARLERELTQHWNQTERVLLPNPRLPEDEPLALAPPAVRRAGPQDTAPPWRFSLRNWRVRSRLTAVVVVPLLATIALAATRITEQVSQVRAYDYSQRLARIVAPLDTVMDAVDNERDTTVQLVSATESGADPNSLTNMAQQRQAAMTEVDQDVLTLGPLTAKIDATYPVATQMAVQEAIAGIGALETLRQEVTDGNASASKIFDGYDQLLDSFTGLHDAIATGASDQELIADNQILTKLTTLTETVSRERGFIAMLLARASWDDSDAPRNLTALQQLIFTAQNQTADFRALASPDMRQYFDDNMAGTDAANALDIINRVVQKLLGTPDPPTLPNDSTVAINMLNALVDRHEKVREAAMGNLVNRAELLSRDTRITTFVNVGVILGIVVLALLGALVIARSLVFPLRVLHNSALEIALSRLPEAVRRLQDPDGTETVEPVAPIALSTTDEVGLVARALDEVHREAVRLATEQAMLRTNVNTMFVNLSRRSQDLVLRQLHLIDELQNGRQDPDQLASSLYQLDHLATRVRRNGENLLVLAGDEPGRRWDQPVQLLDVLRAAVEEVEQYQRIELRDLPDVEVAPTAGDLVHLVAELLENAAWFSAPEAKVTVTGNRISTGGVLVEIQDAGVGMTPEELDEANHRLAHPPLVDLHVRRSLGLFVVGRLATPHGIQVRLRRNAEGGITALVIVPGTLIVPGRSGPGAAGPEGSSSEL